MVSKRYKKLTAHFILGSLLLTWLAPAPTWAGEPTSPARQPHADGAETGEGLNITAGLFPKEATDGALNTLGDIAASAQAENPRVEINVRYAGGGAAKALAEKLMRAILMKVDQPLEGLTLKELLSVYWNSPAHRENFFISVARGTTNSTVISLTFLISDRSIALPQIIPTFLGILGLSGGIHIAIDPFHESLTSGAWAKTVIPSLRKAPEDPAEHAAWEKKLAVATQTEFYVRWALTQLLFLTVINLTLTTTHTWHGQSLTLIAVKTLINTLFSTFAQGAPEALIIDATEAALQRAIAVREALNGPLSAEELANLEKRYGAIRRRLSGAVSVSASTISALRTVQETTLWGAFIPTDWPGWALIGMGVVGVTGSVIKGFKRRKLACVRQMGVADPTEALQEPTPGLEGTN